MSKIMKNEQGLKKRESDQNATAVSKSVEGQLERVTELLAGEQAEVSQADGLRRKKVSDENSAGIELSIVIPCLDEADTARHLH